MSNALSDETETNWSTEGVAEKTLTVLRDLGVGEIEIEVSEMHLEPLVEMAAGGEVMPIDVSDPAGGFGGTDLWIATVVPALAAAQGLRETGALTPDRVEALVDQVQKRVGSPRAERHRFELVRAIRSAFGLGDRMPEST